MPNIEKMLIQEAKKEEKAKKQQELNVRQQTNGSDDVGSRISRVNQIFSLAIWNWIENSAERWWCENNANVRYCRFCCCVVWLAFLFFVHFCCVLRWFLFCAEDFCSPHVFFFFFDLIFETLKGSTAGAGSGEFHVYRAQRRTELTRLENMNREAQLVESKSIRNGCFGRCTYQFVFVQDEINKEFQQRREQTKIAEADKAAKKAAKRKRLKEKQREKKRKQNANKNDNNDDDNEKNDNNSDDDDDNNDDEKSGSDDDKKNE